MAQLRFSVPEGLEEGALASNREYAPDRHAQCVYGVCVMNVTNCHVYRITSVVKV